MARDGHSGPWDHPQLEMPLKENVAACDSPNTLAFSAGVLSRQPPTSDSSFSGRVIHRLFAVHVEGREHGLGNIGERFELIRLEMVDEQTPHGSDMARCGSL